MCWNTLFKGNTIKGQYFLVNCFVEWWVLRKMQLCRSLSTKETTTTGTCKVYKGYSRIPTVTNPWGRGPVSQLLMPGYLQEALAITGLPVSASDGIWQKCHPTLGPLEFFNICWNTLFKCNTNKLGNIFWWIVLWSDGCWERCNCKGHFQPKKTPLQALAGWIQDAKWSQLLKIHAEEVLFPSCGCKDTYRKHLPSLGLLWVPLMAFGWNFCHCEAYWKNSTCAEILSSRATLKEVNIFGWIVLWSDGCLKRCNFIGHFQHKKAPLQDTGYSRIPTVKNPWGWDPVSQLLMPGYLQEELAITGLHGCLWWH